MSRNDKQVLYNILMDENVVELITENNSIEISIKNKVVEQLCYKTNNSDIKCER